jgi:hypothetical protein
MYTNPAAHVARATTASERGTVPRHETGASGTSVGKAASRMDSATQVVKWWPSRLKWRSTVSELFAVRVVRAESRVRVVHSSRSSGS